MRSISIGACPPARCRGVTLPTLILMLAGIAVIGLGVFRLIPVYLSHMKIVGAMSSVQTEFDGTGASKREMLLALEKRFDIEMVNVLQYRDVKVERKGENMIMRAKYDHEVPFIANVHFVVHFDHAVTIAR